MKRRYRLQDMREDHDLKQKDVAEILQISRQYYTRYENEQNEIPVHHLIVLARYYDVSLDYLTGLIDHPHPIEENKIYTTTNERKVLQEYRKASKNIKKAIHFMLNIERDEE